MQHNTLTVIPLGNRIIVRPIARPDGLIIIPERYKDVPTRGLVLAVGKGVKHPEVRIGQEVLVTTHGGSDYTFGDEQVKMFDYEQVLAVVN